MSGGPTHCAQCGSDRIGWDPADGYTCANCGATDADDTMQEEHDRMIEAGWYQVRDWETGEPLWRPPRARRR